MFKKCVLTLCFTLTAFVAVHGQSVYTPERGSAERKSILDALRTPIERELKQKIVFAADTFNVSGNWTFIYGTMQSSEGSQPDFSRTKYAEAQREGFFDNNFQALLKKAAGKWTVIKYQIGCTDVCYTEWWRQHRAPKAIFPYTD